MKQVKKKSKAVSKKPQSARKQASKKPKSASAKTRAAGSTLATTESAENVNVRFSATIHVRNVTDPSWFERLAIDRVPDSTGAIRALVTPADCVRLVNEGFEVRLDAAYPVQPLSPALIETKDSFQRWMDEKIQTAKRAK